jgi:hypothetical protein
MPRLRNSVKAGQRQLNGVVELEHAAPLTKRVELLKAECVTRFLEIDKSLQHGRKVSHPQVVAQQFGCTRQQRSLSE